MRFIKKSDNPPACLTEYISECDTLGVVHPLLYKDFNRTGELRKILCKEQKHICCYCQRVLKGSRIEHLYPENGPDHERSQALQLDYYNMYASCIDSQGKPKNLQYCDVAKGNNIIRAFIADEQCATFFRYTINGEIIPNGEYDRWDDYMSNTLPSGDVTDAFECIKILNLNCPTLISERKQYIDILLKYLVSHTKKDVQEKVTEWNKGETYPSYITMLTQYITRRYPDIAI